MIMLTTARDEDKVKNRVAIARVRDKVEDRASIAGDEGERNTVYVEA
jgi:hypothetical protein